MGEIAPPSDERKLATVLFADLVGSTELAGGQDPERMRLLLDRFYDAMASEIEAAGGTVEKFAGDAVMAAFGAPVAHEDDAERALHAALSMQRRLEELFGDRLSLRIGVNTGEVVVGRPREGSSFVSGDPVNIAARLEQAAAPGEILTGERTVAATRGAFEFGEPKSAEAKGKPEGIRCRPLLRSLSLMRARGVGGLRPAFVGRKGELEELQGAYRSVATRGEPHLVSIVGEAGIGKTTLVRHLWERLGEESPAPLRRTGRCLAYGRGITYWPLAEILREHLGVLESDSPEHVLRRLAGREILGLTLGLDIAGDVHPLAARDRLHDAWVALVEEIVADTPVVLLVEDVHWAEDDLFDLLETLLRQVRGPLLLVATGRPELVDRRPGFGGVRTHGSRIWLEPLAPADTQRMLDSLLAAELPAQLREILVERAEGNPFFVEELVAALIDQGILARGDGGWTVAALPGGFRAPDSVQAVLAARIDLLAPAEKTALQAASVIGRIFWSGPVYELVGELEPDLAVLEERDFIRRRAGSSVAGEREYAIKHALTREVAYSSLPKAKRARLHAMFAAWLERAGEGRAEHASLLAHHYAEAVRPEDADLAWPGEIDELDRLRGKATGWLRRAGALAIGRYEIDEAIALFRRALELEARPGAQAELWREIGRASALRYDGETFWTAMQRGIELSPDLPVTAELYADLAFQTATRAGMWKRRPAPELVDGWIERALELAAPESRAYARALVARAWWDPSSARAAAGEAEGIAERLGDLETRSFAWRALLDAAAGAGDYDEAVAWAKRRFALLPHVTDPDHRADIYWGAAPAFVARGDLAEARRIAGLHDELATPLSPHHRVHAVSILLDVEELAGEWAAIRALKGRAEHASAANVATPCVLNQRTLLVCALAEAELGDEAEAARLESIAESLGMEGFGHVLDMPRARLALLHGDLEAAERLVTDPPGRRRLVRAASLERLSARMDVLAAMGAREQVEAEAPLLLRPRTYLEPFALRALGRVRGDEELIREAEARFTAIGLTWHAAETAKLVAQA